MTYASANVFGGLYDLLQHSPPSLSGISITQDASAGYVVSRTNTRQHLQMLHSDWALFTMLVRLKGPKLMHFSFVGRLNAAMFIQACRTAPTPLWPRLRTLALTSQTLAKEEEPAKASELSCSAAAMARNMPELESLAIWNACQRELCAMIYLRNKDRGQASLIWRGVWVHNFTKSELDAWAAVSGGSGNLHVREVQLNPAEFQTPDEGISRLALPGRVFDSRDEKIRKMLFSG